MAEAREALFEAVRKACFPATWSRGVELTRLDAVIGERADDEEVVFHVTTRGGMICPRVTLYLDDLDWDCECPGRETVCEHVAAAVIIWRQSKDGAALPAPKVAAGRVGYRFRRLAGDLALERVIVCGDVEQPLETTLVAVSEGRVAGPRFLATQQDLAVELVLGTHRRGLVSAQLIPKLLPCLTHCGDVRLDGQPISVDTEPLLPRARVEDEGEGFSVVVEADPSVTERFKNGAALCGRTLRFVGESRLTGRERHDLQRGRHFSPEQVAELVTEVLPSLHRRLPVEINTSRLPETVSEPPRALLDVERRGTTLSVLATLVYGDPPRARIDGGRLVHLQGPVPLREERAEKAQLRGIARLGLSPGVRAEFDGAEAVAFNARLAGWKGGIRGGGHEYFALAAPLVPHVEISDERFDVAFESTPLDGGGRPAAGKTSRADPAAVLRAWRQGDSLVPLTGGGWAPLPADWLGRHGPRIAALLEAREPDGELPRCCLPDLARLCEELDRPAPPELGRLRQVVEDFDGIAAAELPGDLRTTLRAYQIAGVNWLAFLRDHGLGAMLADDMGLGKTLQALCALNAPCLVVAPTSVLYNWANEIAAHRPGLSHNLYHGANRKLDPDADVTLTSYAILRIDADRLASVKWKTVILDEAQRIKNPGSQVAGAAFRLDAEFRLTLSGTPIENRLDELWSQFHFINRGLLGGRSAFQEQFADPISSGDEQAAARLRERIRPFILRRLKREVAAELPPRTEMVLRCELDEQEREIYDSVRAATLSEVVRKLGEGGNVLAALEALLRLRQAACHGSLIPGQQAEHSSKLRALMDALDNVVADGHRALVFSQWTSLLDLIEPQLATAGIDHVRLDGSTRNRGKVVDRFQADDGPPVMLISLMAGGIGLNLTAADHIFLMDPWWNPAVEEQAADRAHRIGQQRPVMIYRLVAMETVEERILELQARKRDLAQAVLDGTGQPAGLTREDLMELLR